MPDTPSLREACLAILRSGSLATKLAPLPATVCDADPGPAIDVEAPVRDPDIALRRRAGPLPRPARLVEPEARAVCLARFAHHELMAVELFAWALLRWPALDASLRRDFARVLADEQRHCRLYLARLEAHGSRLAAHTLSDYFWMQLPAIRRSPAGPAAFLSAMGLTLEQANLDFTLLYRDAFREAGDEASARVCQRVHDDEIGHVRIAIQWLRRLPPGASLGDDTARYEASVPFPLSASRAKGRRFDARARRRAGLDAGLIEHVRHARSSQQAARPAVAAARDASPASEGGSEP